jgi:predicted alpha/beta-hydrolase family hydrolase
MSDTEKKWPWYKIEPARSGRATCKKCKQKIERGCIRVGVVTKDFRDEDGEREIVGWVHALASDKYPEHGCFIEKLRRGRVNRSVEGGVDGLQGFDDLDTSVQKAVRTLMAAHEAWLAEPTKPKKATKKRKAGVDGDDESPKKRKKKKKKKSAEKEAKTKKEKAVARPLSQAGENADGPLFLVAAGAGGALPGETDLGEVKDPSRFGLRILLEGLGRVVGPIRAQHRPKKAGAERHERLKGFQGASAGAILSHRLAAADAEDLADCRSNDSIVLVGQSFGGRVAVHSLIGEPDKAPEAYKSEESREKNARRMAAVAESTLPDTVRGLILFGYPAHHDEDDRGQFVRKIPAGTKVLFVMGEKDEQHLAALRRALKGCARDVRAGITLHVAEGGKHYPFDGPKKTLEARRAGIEAAVAEFVAACCA